MQGGAGLIKKVAFRHEHLVLSILLAQLVTVCIDLLLVLSATFLVFGHFMFHWLIPMALLLVLISRCSRPALPLRCQQRTSSSTTSTTSGIAAEVLFRRARSSS